MKKFEVVKARHGRAVYWVERVAANPMAMIHTKAKAEKVAKAFSRHVEHWSAVTRSGMTIVTLELRPIRDGGPYFRAVGGIDWREDGVTAEDLSLAMDHLQRDAYRALARHAIGPH